MAESIPIRYIILQGIIVGAVMTALGINPVLVLVFTTLGGFWTAARWQQFNDVDDSK